MHRDLYTNPDKFLFKDIFTFIQIKSLEGPYTYANDFYPKGTRKLEEEEKTLKEKKTSYASTLFDVMIMGYYFYN